MEETAETQSDIQPARLDLQLLVVGKRAGLSFNEINEFRVRDLMQFVDVLTESTEGKKKRATQSEIDAFFT